MVARDQKNVDPGGQEKEKKTVERSAGAGEDTCRCKEVSEMKPRKLLGLVISDLAFWKKAKKG